MYKYDLFRWLHDEEYILNMYIQLVFSHLNELPKESHDTDFSRIKPWYLDGQYVLSFLSLINPTLSIYLAQSSAYLRQSILLSAFETPETRALFNTNLHNVAGKTRTEKKWNAVKVPEGLDQVRDNVSIWFP